MYETLIRLVVILSAILIMASCGLGFGMAGGRSAGGGLIRINSPQTTDVDVEIATFKWRSGTYR